MIVVINLWWLWLLIGLVWPPMLVIGVIMLVLKLLSLLDTSELTLKGLKGRPLSEAEKQRNREVRKWLWKKITRKL